MDILDIDQDLQTLMLPEVLEVTGTVAGLLRDLQVDYQDQQEEEITIRQEGNLSMAMAVILGILELVDWERGEVEPRETVDILMELPQGDQLVVQAVAEEAEDIPQGYLFSLFKHRDLDKVVVLEVQQAQAVE